MKKTILCIVAAACFACLSFQAQAKPQPKLKVITTLFPTYDFARQIGGDKAEVRLLLPPGVEPHAFEPKPGDILGINKADVFIYTGQYMEPWAEDLLKGIDNKSLLVVDASRGIALFDEADEDEDEEEEGEEAHHDEAGEHEHGHHHHHGGKDPHIWMDLGNAAAMVDTLAEAFAQKDPANSACYAANAQAYKGKLAALDERFKETFSRCRLKTFIYGGHFAFGYFAKRYGLTHISPYRGFSPSAEPAPQAMIELVRTTKELGVKYIYHEELLEPRVAQAIARETGAGLLLLHGIHNLSKKELDAGVTYLSLMEQNMDNLKKGLEYR